MNVGYILTPLAVAQVVIGLWLIFSNRKNQAAIWYGFFMIGVGLYVGANGLGYLHWLLTQGKAEHLAWTGGAMTATFILPFSFSFPYPRKSVRELLPLVLWPLIIFLPGILWSSAFIIQQAIVNFGNGYTTQPGDYFWFFLVFFAGYWLWAFINFFRSLKTADGIHRKNLVIFLTGTIISVAVSCYFDVYMPLTHATRFGYVGSLFSSVWFGFTSYILVRK